MNGSEVRLSAFVFEIVGLAATTTYKCHESQMDSMGHVRDSVPKVYSYRLYPMVDNEDYHLQRNQFIFINGGIYYNLQQRSNLFCWMHSILSKFSKQSVTKTCANKLLYI